MAKANLVLLDLLRGLGLTHRQTARDPRRLHSRWPLSHRAVLVIGEVNLVEHRRVDVDVRPQGIQVRKSLAVDPLLIQTNHRVELYQVQIVVYIIFRIRMQWCARILTALLSRSILFCFFLQHLQRFIDPALWDALGYSDDRFCDLLHLHVHNLLQQVFFCALVPF